MSLIIYGIIFSGPLMHTDTPSGTVLLGQFENLVFVIMSTRENIRLIARNSFTCQEVRGPG